MAKEYIDVLKSDDRLRIDKLLANKLPEYSRSALAKLFLLNLIKKDGEPLMPGDKVKTGFTIEYDLGPLKEVPEVIALPVIYEDKNVVVVDKPAGIISHARGKFWQEASVASFMRDKVARLTGERSGIVHRLDRPTSGVMICAKNQETLKFLQKQFADRKVQKTYIAITDKKPKKEHAKIIAPIARNLKDPRTFCVNKTGKKAETEYRVIKSNNDYTMIELKPHTGRTHQLRVHLAYINCPVIGDELYKGASCSRLLLHAKKLSILLPDGKKTTFQSELPKEFNVYK